MRLIALALALWAAALGRDGLDAWIDATELPPLTVATSDEVRGAGGALLRAYTVDDGLWRLATGVGQVDPAFLAALVHYEDKRFWHHRGIDPHAMVRAAWDAARQGRVVSGGSTLTMQVARLLEDGTTGRWAGKLRQMRVALALERRLSKEGILHLYLHHAPYGGNLEGVRAAAWAYFGREPGRLTPSQIAYLVALPQGPEARRPDRHPAEAFAAAARVRARLVAAGVFPREADLDPPPALRPFPAHAPHLADRARGLAGTLTVEVDLQVALARLAAATARGVGREVSVAILVADHRTGEIRASVGSAGYGDARSGYLDMTRALRSPGSTLKPLVYGLAFDAGRAHPETILPDRPHDFGGYRPSNFDGRFRGEISAREALVISLNLPVVHLTDRLGPARLMAALRAAGTDPRAAGTPGLAVALGGVGVTLKDLVRLYGAFARGGQSMALTATAGSGVAPTRVLGPVAAWYVTDTLRQTPAPPGHRGGDIAFKTGTSYGHRDTWAVGYDGGHVVGVWVGRPDGTPVPGAFGGQIAAPLLFQAFAQLEATPFPPPPAAALTVAHADLPHHLRRLEPADSRPDLTVAFPPDGATLLADGPVPGRVREGTAPFTWLANGLPLAVAPGPSVELPIEEPGFHTLTVVDAAGASARVTIRLTD